MNRLMGSIVSAGLCLVLLAGCAMERDGISVTFYGRVESIDENAITLKPGAWEDGAFIEDEDAAPVSVKRNVAVAQKLADSSFGAEELQVGMVICFSMCVSMDGEETVTSFEILEKP